MGQVKPEHQEILRQLDGLLASAQEHLLMVEMDKTARVKRVAPGLRKYERRLDYALLAKNVVLAHKVGLNLQRAYPNASKKTLEDVSVGLADLWRVSETLRRNMPELARFSPNRTRLGEILSIVGYQHAPEAEEHAKELRRAIPLLFRSNDRKGKKRARTKRKR